MKKYRLIATAFVLFTLTLAGCRNTNGNLETTAAPTTQATSMPTTPITTMPSTEGSEPSIAPAPSGTTDGSEATGGQGSGAQGTEESTNHGQGEDNSSSATGEGRARAPRVR